MLWWLLLLLPAAVLRSAAAAPPDQPPDPARAAYGSGRAGSWQPGAAGLPCYQLHPLTRLPNSWQAGLQLGNDRLVALVGGDGSLSVRQDEGSPKFLTGQREGWAAGVGWLSSSPEPFASGAINLLGTHWPLNVSLASQFPTASPNLTREACAGYVRRVASTSDLRLEQRVIAPYGDDPVLVSEVTVTNTGPTVWDVWYTQAWPSQWAHLDFFQHMAKQAGSNFSTFLDPVRFAAEHYAVTHEKRADGLGLTEHRRWLGLSVAEKAEVARISAVLDASNVAIGGLMPGAANASVWDRRPPAVFLVSLDGETDSGGTHLGNDAAAFYGNGGASAPSALTQWALEGSASRGLPWNSSVTGAHCALLLSRRIRGLFPGESRTLRFIWGYSASSAEREALIAKYRVAPGDLLNQSSRAWRESSLRFTVTDPSMAWLGRELQWHNYMLRAGTTFDDFFGEKIINQATSYLYGDGLQAAARDPLQHLLPLIATAPDIARSVIRYTLKELVVPSSWPRGYQRDALPYSLMSHGLVWPNRERGPSDLDLYVLLAASEYVLQTKDTAFLSETLTTHTLFGGVGATQSVLACLLECYEHLVGPDISVGKHGLLRMLTSDWSDVIYHDRAHLVYGSLEWKAAVQTGESVMNAALAAYVLPRFGSVLRMAGKSAMANNVTAFGKAQAEAMRRFAWTGQWFKRAFIDDNKGWIGGAEDQIETGAQPWALLAGVLDPTNASILVGAIQKGLRANDSFGARQLAKGYPLSNDDKVGTEENGGVWHALNFPLAQALNMVNHSLGLDEFLKNSMAVHAERFPTQFNGIWTASDVANSNLVKKNQGVPGSTGVLCMHRHAWPLFSAMQILGGAQFDEEGVTLAPHPILLTQRFELHTPLVSVAHDGEGRWSGHYAPGGGGGGQWRVQLMLSSGTKHTVAMVSGANRSQDNDDDGRATNKQWSFADPRQKNDDESKQPDGEEECKFKPLSGMDLPGGTLKHFRANTSDECGSACCAITDCAAFTWTRWVNWNSAACPIGSPCCFPKPVSVTWKPVAEANCTSGMRTPLIPPTPPPPPPPPPHVLPTKGGGSCRSIHDCLGGGECVGGACVCDAMWTGTHCVAMDLLPVDAAVAGFPRSPASGLPTNETFPWGGALIQDDDGIFHLFATEWLNNCPMRYDTFTTSTHIAHLTSTRATGPWIRHGVAVPPAAGNPAISQAPDGTYLLYFTCQRWLGASQQNCSSKNMSSWGHPVVNPRSCATTGGATLGISLAYSTDLVSWRYQYDIISVPASNPGGPLFLPNGTMLLPFQTWPPTKPCTSPSCITFVTAPSWKSWPYNTYPLGEPGTAGACIERQNPKHSGSVEDPSNIWCA